MVVFPIGHAPRELDCNWGSITPESIRAFVVTVFPKKPRKQSLNEWYFIIMLPEDEKAEVKYDYLKICQSLAEYVVETGDRYIIDPLGAEKEVYDATTPVISYDPRVVDQGVVSPFWLIPPSWLTN